MLCGLTFLSFSRRIEWGLHFLSSKMYLFTVGSILDHCIWVIIRWAFPTLHYIYLIYLYLRGMTLGGTGDRRRRGWQRISWLDGISVSMGMSLNKFRELVMGREAWRAAIHGITKSQTRLSGWTELNWRGMINLHLEDIRDSLVIRGLGFGAFTARATFSPWLGN